ncbi:MAG: hypothetical protein ACKOC8_12370 [Pirellulales bacterium]
MADDDKNSGDAFDPWADLESDASPAADGFSFSFEDASLDAEVADGSAESPEEMTSSDDAPPAAEQPAFAEGGDTADLGDVGDVGDFGDFGDMMEAGASMDVTDAFPGMDDLASLDAGETPEEKQADDALAASWLDEPAADAGGEREIDLQFGEAAEAPVETTLGVFSPDDTDATDEPQDAIEPFADSAAAGEPSEIEIGTGTSAISSPSDIDAMEGFAGFGEPGDAPSPDDEPAEQFSFGDMASQAGETTADETETIAFAAAAAGAAVAVAGGDAAAPTPAKRPGRAKPKKQSGIGQMLGVVLGGAMAIPITLAILIWGFKKDPFKVTKHVPESVAFLLPAQFQKGYVKPLEGGPDLSDAPSLDDLPSADTAVVDPATEPAPADVATEELVAEEPLAQEPADEPAAMEEPEEPASGEVAASNEPMEEPAVPESPPAPPAAPEPPPLDTAALDGAVGDASTALDALRAVVDPDDPVRKTLMIDWYKHVARVAEELALLEREAADTARPLQATPENVAALHAAVVATPGLIDDLERLSRNWLAYSKRPSDGVVLPATFGGARRVGPFWRSQVTIAEAGGKSREVTVISRTEPAVLPGDVVLVTGLVLAGDVVWGADVRSARADPAAEPSADPFATPDL